jgi:hypothetical protein
MADWQDGKMTVKPSGFALPMDVYHLAHELFKENAAQLEAMFWDETKRTMATLEKQPTSSLQTFSEEQHKYARMLHEKLGDRKDIRIDTPSVAVDIELMTVGKHAGAELIYQWIEEKRGQPGSIFVSIGDSPSDFPMALCFAERGAKSTFVFVGEKLGDVAHDERVAYITTEKKYALGALEYFESQNLHLVGTAKPSPLMAFLRKLVPSR